MRPKALVIDDGLWFMTRGKQNYAGFQNATRRRLTELIPISKKV